MELQKQRSERTRNYTAITKMKTIAKVFDRIKIVQIISIWISTVFIFGVIYFFSNNLQHFQLNKFGDALYFSFVTALTIGYGQLVQNTSLQVLIIIQTLLSIVLFGLLIVKISLIENKEIKQEIKNLSFDESTHNLISQMYLLRNDLKDVKKSEELNFVVLELSSIVNSFKKISDLVDSQNPEKHSMHISLISNSLNISLSRLVGLLEKFNKKRKNESITTILDECDIAITKLETTYRDDSNVGEKLKDLNKTLEELKKLSKA